MPAPLAGLLYDSSRAWKYLTFIIVITDGIVALESTVCAATGSLCRQRTRIGHAFNLLKRGRYVQILVILDGNHTCGPERGYVRAASQGRSRRLGRLIRAPAPLARGWTLKTGRLARHADIRWAANPLGSL